MLLEMPNAAGDARAVAAKACVPLQVKANAARRSKRVWGVQRCGVTGDDFLAGSPVCHPHPTAWLCRWFPWAVVAGPRHLDSWACLRRDSWAWGGAQGPR
ncbi:hypothetical protein NDU88_008805 [Pleurodeles waltl]|uniref:Uncharacterized protein n=1 Tax=Pleurodeles waltl TaxID=8319 RepID=A0AAV7RYQ2_PLEWA|nr:hypothetical protein NDU88_008805 [Pleurodeles waltl]